MAGADWLQKAGADLEKTIFLQKQGLIQNYFTRKMRKFWQKSIWDKTGQNVFDNNYEQNKSATHL